VRDLEEQNPKGGSSTNPGSIREYLSGCERGEPVTITVTWHPQITTVICVWNGELFVKKGCPFLF